MNRRIALEGKIRLELLCFIIFVAAALNNEQKVPIPTSKRLLQQVSFQRNSRLRNSLLVNSNTQFRSNSHHHQPIDYRAIANQQRETPNNLLSQLQQGKVIVQPTFFGKQSQQATQHQTGFNSRAAVKHRNEPISFQPVDNFRHSMRSFNRPTQQMSQGYNQRHMTIHNHMNNHHNGRIFPHPVGHGNHFGNKFQDPRLNQLFPDGNSELIKKQLTDEERGDAIANWINANPPKDEDPHKQIPQVIDHEKFDYYSGHTHFQRRTIAHRPDPSKPKKHRFGFNSPSSPASLSKASSVSGDDGYMSGSAASSRSSSTSGMSMSSDNFTPADHVNHFPKGHVMAN